MDGFDYNLEKYDNMKKTWPLTMALFTPSVFSFHSCFEIFSVYISCDETKSNMVQLKYWNYCSERSFLLYRPNCKLYFIIWEPKSTAIQTSIIFLFYQKKIASAIRQPKHSSTSVSWYEKEKKLYIALFTSHKYKTFFFFLLNFDHLGFKYLSMMT